MTERKNEMAVFYGLKIIEDPNMTEEGEPYEVARSWRERLFTRPWEPFRSTKMVVPQVPMSSFIQKGTTLIGHPELVRALMNELPK